MILHRVRVHVIVSRMYFKLIYDLHFEASHVWDYNVHILICENVFHMKKMIDDCDRVAISLLVTVQYSLVVSYLYKAKTNIQVV